MALYFHGLSAQPLSVTHCIDVSVRNECWAAAYIWGPDGLIAERHAYLGNPSDERFVVKDHLGSIRLALDADDGSVQAWRDYAPFGEVMRGADMSIVLRYTYTGQEADTEIGLMNYQARLYDPEIGIFLAVDPAGQVASPYAYTGNNPISFVDPDGEFFLEAIAIFAAVNYTADVLRGNVNSLGDALLSLGKGALQGGLATLGPAGASVQALAATAVASQLPAPTITVGNISIGINPIFAYGDNGWALGASIFGVYDAGGGVTFGLGASLTHLNSPLEALGNSESRLFAFGGYTGERWSFSYSLTQYWGGEANQFVASVQGGYGGITLRHDNDVWFMGGDGDKYRTAAMRLGIGDFGFGFQLFTGEGIAPQDGSRIKVYENPEADAYRQGLFYFEFGAGSGAYRLGVDSEPARAFVQNTWHRLIGSPDFRKLDRPIRPFIEHVSRNPFSIY